MNSLRRRNCHLHFFSPVHESYLLLESLCYFRMDGWIDGLLFYVLFYSISVKSRRWVGDNERLCANEPQVGLDHWTARSALNPLSCRSFCYSRSTGKLLKVFAFVIVANNIKISQSTLGKHDYKFCTER